MKIIPNTRLKQVKKFKGQVDIVASKSFANRMVLASALCEKKTLITNLPPARDVEHLISALESLGVKIKKTKKKLPSGSVRNSFIESIEIDAKARHDSNGSFLLKQKKLKLYLGNAGTALRPLTAILSASRANSVYIYGNSSMNKRPIRNLVETLQKKGVNIMCSSHGTPPVVIYPKGFSGGVIEIDASKSSQFLSAMLMLSPLADKETNIRVKNTVVSKPYIDLTVNFLTQYFDIQIEREGYDLFRIYPQKYKSPLTYEVEGDATAATYFFAAGALPHCGPIRVHGLRLDSLQGDLRFLDVIEKMGAQITKTAEYIEVQNPTSTLKGIDIDMNDMPDAAITLAVLALFANSPTKIRNIANLQLKESPRLDAIEAGLCALGASVVKTSHDLHITPPANLKKAKIHSYNDHRIAMAFSLASFGTQVTIQKSACVSKTYGNFFVDWKNISHY